MQWNIHSIKQVYSGFFKLSQIYLQHELFTGGQSPLVMRERIDRGNAVAVLPYDPVRDKVVLVEQFRIGACGKESNSNPWLLEVIAGYQEPGETSEAVVHREAEEEAGCTISNLQLLYNYYSSPGSSSERIKIYFARTDSTNINGIHGLKDEGEDIKVHAVDSTKAFEWLDAGRIDSAVPIIALQWFRQNRKRVRNDWLKA